VHAGLEQAAATTTTNNWLNFRVSCIQLQTFVHFILLRETWHFQYADIKSHKVASLTCTNRYTIQYDMQVFNGAKN